VEAVGERERHLRGQGAKAHGGAIVHRAVGEAERRGTGQAVLEADRVERVGERRVSFARGHGGHVSHARMRSGAAEEEHREEGDRAHAPRLRGLP
jgi:hypothetical protein